MRAGRWTDERVEMLKQLCAGGASAQTIAEQIGGVSRSAVLGKIFRLRLGAAPSAGAKAAEAPPLKRSPGPRPRRGKTLLELTNHSCRWPHGEPGRRGFHFCGADTADLERGMPYCARHARLAYGTDPAIVESNKPKRATADATLATLVPAPARLRARRS